MWLFVGVGCLCALAILCVISCRKWTTALPLGDTPASFSVWRVPDGPSRSEASRRVLPLDGNNTLSVLTINAWTGLSYNGVVQIGSRERGDQRQRRFNRLVELILELGPDVVMVQEANPCPVYARALAGAIAYDCVWRTGIPGLRLRGLGGIPVNLCEGLVILARPSLGLEGLGRAPLVVAPDSRVPAWAKDTPMWTAVTDDATHILAARVTLPNGRMVALFNTHWHSAHVGDAAAIAHIRTLCKRAGVEPGRTAALVADMRPEMARTNAAWHDVEERLTADFVREHTRNLADAFVLCGDFNAAPAALEGLCRELPTMIDAFNACHPGDDGYTWDPHHNDHLQTEHSKDGRRRAAAAITAAARVWPTNLILPADVYDELEGAMEDVPERLDYVFLGVGGRDGRLFAKKESRRKRLHLSPDRGRTSATVVAGYEVVGCRVVGGQPGQCVSDHSGVLAELSFPEPAV